MAIRTPNEINAGSMADIAFLLLIFFLVTTTMDQDEGIKTKLPPKNLTDERRTMLDRDILEILINDANKILIEKEPSELQSIDSEVRKFYLNPGHLSSYPSLRTINAQLCEAKLIETQTKEGRALWQKRKSAIAVIGRFEILPSKAVISIQNHRQTSYAMYIAVYNEIRATVNKLRNELSEKKFNVKFSELDPHLAQDKIKIEAILAVIPNRISEAEPFE